MAWAWVYVNQVWHRGSISHHQPMNWRDSIRASDNRHTSSCSHCVSNAALSEPMKENYSQHFCLIISNVLELICEGEIFFRNLHKKIYIFQMHEPSLVFILWEGWSPSLPSAACLWQSRDEGLTVITSPQTQRDNGLFTVSDSGFFVL